MPITSIPTYASGDTIEASWANTLRDNGLVLDGRTGGDPGGADKWLVSSSSTAAAWVARLTAVLAAIGYTPVNRNGDTMTNDLKLTRTATPTQGYLILGTNTAYYVGFDGTKHVFQTPQVDVQNDLYVYRAGAPTTGFLILGNSSAHYIGFDGTNVVIEGFKAWHAGNDGTGSGLDADLFRGVNALARANHTGTQLAATISDLAAAVATLTAAVANAIADGAVSTAAKIAAGIITDSHVNAANKDGAAGTASLRTLGTGAAQAAAGSHTHTGMAKIASGTYTGNGGSRSVTGLGFSPKAVFVQQTTTTSGRIMFFMGHDAVTFFHLSSPSFLAGQSLDADGFTVSAGASMNNVGESYRWWAVG